VVAALSGPFLYFKLHHTRRRNGLKLLVRRTGLGQDKELSLAVRESRRLRRASPIKTAEKGDTANEVKKRDFERSLAN